MGRLFSRIARSSELGAELVEYALVAPILFLVLLGIAEFGLLFQAFQVVSNAAREGARMGILACDDGTTGCYAASDVQARVASFVTAGLPGSAATPATVAQCVTIVPPNGSGYAAEKVTVTYTYRFMFIGGISRIVGGSFGDVPITSVSTMRRENQSSCP